MIATNHPGKSPASPGTPNPAPEETAAKPSKLLRLPAVEERTALKKSTLYRLVRTGALAPPVQLSERAVAWREADIDRFIEERAVVERR